MSRRALSSEQFTQLDMWRPARELVRDTEHGDLGLQSTEELFAEKRGNASAAFVHSIKKHGVQTPVQVYHGDDTGPGGVLADGHHRMVVAHDIDPKMLVPVQHHAPDDEISPGGAL